MSMSPKTIRARTLECIHLAQNTKNAHHKSLLLEVAHSCADLANALDRFQIFAQAAEIPSLVPALKSSAARRVTIKGRSVTTHIL